MALVAFIAAGTALIGFGVSRELARFGFRVGLGTAFCIPLMGLAVYFFLAGGNGFEASDAWRRALPLASWIAAVIIAAFLVLSTLWRRAHGLSTTPSWALKELLMAATMILVAALAVPDRLVTGDGALLAVRTREVLAAEAAAMVVLLGVFALTHRQIQRASVRNR